MNYIWYKNAIFYSLDVETFYDANGDGIGDFEGLIDRLDYLAGLGINCLWLLPFYPSPNRDNGYDITDYYNIDPRLGSLGDFAEFMDKAGQLGIRVIIDLVVNHTSVHHPWFQAARKDRGSRYRDYYVWSDDPPAIEKEKLVFSGEEETVWTYDESAGQYYLHRFYKEQPDLNIGNQEVRNEILKIMGFWMKFGVSGFRIDAAEKLIEPFGIKAEGSGDFADFLTEMREFIAIKESRAILIAETNILPDRIPTYLDSGNRMHMVFNFYLNQHLFLSLATQSSASLYNHIGRLPGVGSLNQWLNFLRHHDELNLNLLSPAEQESVLKAFAPDESMRIFRTGIRRRLAPMLQGDSRLMKLAYSLLFCLPGIPLLRYGDEIGMGDNLELPGRLSVRTPMQWSEAPQAGFSSKGKNVICPVISGGDYGFEKVNARRQQWDPASFLNWVEQLISARKQFGEIGRGVIELIRTEHPALFVHRFSDGPRNAYFIHNLSSDPVSVDTEILSVSRDRLYELFGDQESSELSETVWLEPFGFKWLKEEQGRSES